MDAWDDARVDHSNEHHGRYLTSASLMNVTKKLEDWADELVHPITQPTKHVLVLVSLVLSQWLNSDIHHSLLVWIVL